MGKDPRLFAAAGDIQAKPTRVRGGFDLLVITGQTIVGPSDYILRLVFFIITGETIVSPSDYILLVVFSFFYQEPFEVFS